jgi:two-component system invasion response regulator UvrY
MATAALIDDHAIFRDVLKLLFEQSGGPRVVAEASDPDEAFERVGATRPDVVLLDMVFQTGESGLQLAKELLDRDPRQRILFVSMVKDAKKVADALRMGALGYVTKDQAPSELIEAVREVLAGHQYVSTRIAVQEASQHPARLLDSLTRREREVFDLVVAGHSSKVTAQRLSISPRTVETHRSRLMAKMGVRSATDLVRLAARLGYVN